MRVRLKGCVSGLLWEPIFKTKKDARKRLAFLGYKKVRKSSKGAEVWGRGEQRVSVGTGIEEPKGILKCLRDDKASS